MALFNEKYKDLVRVVKIGKSIELCGGTHTDNTSNIKRFAINLCESKGSNLYRIEAVTGKKIEQTLYETIKPYNDEIIKQLMKAKTIVDEANKLGIKLNFDVDLNNNKPQSYKDIIFSKNEYQYVLTEVKNLEKKYFELKEQKMLNDLDPYMDKVNINYLIMKVENKEINLLKSLCDTLLIKMGNNSFIFFSNIKSDGSVNFISRSNCSLNAGLIVKHASITSLGNGGGSATFAQGGGKTTDKLEEIYEHIERVLDHEE